MNTGKKAGARALKPGSALVEDVIKDPTERFSSPAEVLADASLSHDQKVSILNSWVQDAKSMAEAESENMGGGEKSRLRESLLALATLTPPTPPSS